jgi:hypothetical protein
LNRQSIRLTFFVVLRIDPDAWREMRESLRIPADDRPIGEDQVLAWWRRRRGG